MKDELICDICKVPLKEARTVFHYLGHDFTAEVPRCPVCGQIFISEDLVREKMQAVEMELEDK